MIKFNVGCSDNPLEGICHMNLNDLLVGKKIDPKEVLVLRHSPTERELKKALPSLAAENPDVFNAYQQTQTQKVEGRMMKAKYIASFIGHESGKAKFVGLYSNTGWKPITPDEYRKIPANAELKKYGHEGFNEESSRSTILWFDLAVMKEFYTDLKGKLIVNWPQGEINWHRMASDVELQILEPEWGMISVNDGGEIQKIFLPATPDELDRVLREVRLRLGQSEFRKQLIAAYNGMCAVTDFDAVDALEAAHIRPYSGPTMNTPWNGLLLRADIHTLFDLNLLMINPETMAIVLDDSLKSTTYGELHGKPIRQPKDEQLRPKIELLQERWKKWITGQTATVVSADHVSAFHSNDFPRPPSDESITQSCRHAIGPQPVCVTAYRPHLESLLRAAEAPSRFATSG